MSYKKLYKRYLENPTTRYFVLDSRYEGDKNFIEKDFSSYMWSTQEYNQVSSNDLFLYRRPGRGTNNDGFYFFGSGRIGYIEDLFNDGVLVKADITDPIVFSKFIAQGEKELENYSWKFKQRKNDWHNFFNQYGMTEITKEDFIALLDIYENYKN